MHPDADPAAEAKRVCGAHCPRCGYDVSGEVETWKDSCPLIGRCSECGVRFRWLHALRPDWCDADGRVQRWSFEQGDRVSLWRFVRTSMRLLVPERFFGGLCKHHARRGWRVAAMLVIWAGVYGMALAGPALAARLFPYPEVYGLVLNADMVVRLFWDAWPFWMGCLLVPLTWMVSQMWTGVTLARWKRMPGIGFGDASRLAVYGVCSVLILNLVIDLGIWAFILGQFTMSWTPIAWIGVLLGVVWSFVVLVQWWPLALANFFHCRRRGVLSWLPTAVGAVAGACVGGTIYLVYVF